MQLGTGLFAQSDYCTERESEVCARKSEDGANPHFVHNVHVIICCIYYMANKTDDVLVQYVHILVT